MLTTVYLHGHLADKYGERFELAVHSVSSALKLLAANFQGFENDIIGHDYHVLVGKSSIGDKELHNPNAGQDIHLIPVVAGSGASTWQIIIGVVLIVVGVLTSWAGGAVLIDIGIGLVIGGIAGLIFAVGPAKIGDVYMAGEKKSTYHFSGAVNTTTQGNPIPILYGTSLVGSQVISASITTVKPDAAGVIASTKANIMRAFSDANKANPVVLPGSV